MWGQRIVAFCVLCVLLPGMDSVGVPQDTRVQSKPDIEPSIKAPFEINEVGYAPTGYMGDGELGSRYVKMSFRNCEPLPINKVSNCYEISYAPGFQRWAGVYWQLPANNWGDRPGKKIVGASRIRFWAKGTRGREVVEFKAGGINSGGKKFRDSFEASQRFFVLSQEWREYEISLRGRNLSSVIGGFAWVATADANPGGLVFYLAHISYE